jgi:hypothetical protein
MARNWSAAMNPAISPTWGIPPEVILEFTALTNTADAVLVKAENEATRTPVVNLQCAEAFAALVKKMRFIKNHYFLVPPLTEADLVGLGLKPADKTRTPIPEPNAEVTATVRPVDAHLIEVRDIRPRQEHSTDPRSDDAVDIHIGIVGGVGPFAIEAPPDPAQGRKLPFVLTTRRRRERFDLEGNSGKIAWVSLAYRNPSGKVGPFCPPFQVVIP